MNSSVLEASLEVSGSTPNETEMRSRKQFVSSSLRLEQLIEKKDYWGFLKGEEAALYLRLLSELSDEEFAALYSDQVRGTGAACARCRGTLIGCRAGAKYCSPSCRQMAYAKRSRTTKKPI